MIVFFQAEDGIRYLVRSRGLGDVYKRQGIKKSYENNPDRKEKLKIAINKRNLKGENHPMYGLSLIHI